MEFIPWNMARNRLTCGLCNKITDECRDGAYWYLTGDVLMFKDPGELSRNSSNTGTDVAGLYLCEET